MDNKADSFFGALDDWSSKLKKESLKDKVDLSGLFSGKAMTKQDKLRQVYPNNPTCICGGVMLERTNKKTGDTFWGCSNYPTCTNTEEI